MINRNEALSNWYWWGYENGFGEEWLDPDHDESYFNRELITKEEAWEMYRLGQWEAREDANRCAALGVDPKDYLVIFASNYLY